MEKKNSWYYIADLGPIFKLIKNSTHNILSLLFHFSYSKTIVHAGSKFSSGEASKVFESMLDQENLSESTNSSWKLDSTKSLNMVNNKAKDIKDISKETKNVSKETKITKEKGTKRPLEGESSSQVQKKQKGEKSKTVRRKLLPQVKGQQQLTKFFRM